MADNIIAPAAGTVFRTRDISGVHHSAGAGLLSASFRTFRLSCGGGAPVALAVSSTPCRVVYLQAWQSNAGAVKVLGPADADGPELRAGNWFPWAIEVDDLIRIRAHGSDSLDEVLVAYLV